MSLFTELQRRNVIRVGIAYVVAAWVLLQVADLVLENIGAPDWVIQAMMLFVVLGFIAALVVAWAYELTPEGIRRERDVDSGQSITHQTGRKLDRIIIGFLAVAVAYFFWEARFAGDAVTPVPDDTAPTARESEAGGPTASTPEVPGTAAAAANSIAVLPFANRSRLEDDEFFTDGIHDDLLTQLAKVRDLKVISRTSMTKYKGTTLTIPEIASELQVATILEGGVQRAGKRIRINAQLIDVATDEHLWAETYDREMTMENIFDIQSEITRRIVSAVRGELTAEESQAIGALPTSSVAAYEAYLKARAFENMANYAQENFVQAQPWAEMAVQLDPQFAQAWALLARLHGMAIWMGYDNTEARRTAMSHAVETAKRLAPDEPWSLVAEAEYLYRVKRDFPASLAALQEAHAALPGDVDILEAIALAQRRVGLWEESVDSAYSLSCSIPRAYPPPAWSWKRCPTCGSGTACSRSAGNGRAGSKAPTWTWSSRWHMSDSPEISSPRGGCLTASVPSPAIATPSR